MTNNKPKFLKNLLTTASALAVLAGGASSAMGVTVQTGGNERLSAAGTWNAAQPNNGDDIQYDVNGRRINADVAGFVIQAIDLNNKAPSAFTINQSLSIGSIDNSGLNKLTINFNADKTLTLTGTAGGAIGGNTYASLGKINFKGNAGGGQITGNVDSTVGGKGTLNFTAAGGVTQGNCMKLI